MDKLKVLAIVLLFGVFSLAGCQKGPAEKAGESVDHAVDKAKDAVTPDGPAENAGEKVDKAVDNMKDEMQKKD